MFFFRSYPKKGGSLPIASFYFQNILLEKEKYLCPGLYQKAIGYQERNAVS